MRINNDALSMLGQIAGRVRPSRSRAKCRAEARRGGRRHPFERRGAPGESHRRTPSERIGASQDTTVAAVNAPRSCMTMKGPTSIGRIPAKVLVSARAIVTAGLPNDVEGVNQYAATI